MKPLFSIQAGEYLVACEIEQQFKHVNIWVPSRDTGIDLLVTDRRNRKSISLQVKFSRDFLPKMKPNLRMHSNIRAAGWYPINWSKLNQSTADLWVFVLPSFAHGEYNFIIVPPKELARRIRSIRRPQREIVHSYLWVTERKPRKCWETRDLGVKDQGKIADSTYNDPKREFTPWLEKWDRIERLDTA